MKVALIGGSGLYDFEKIERVSVRRITTTWGEPSAPVTCGTLNGTEVMFLPRHGPSHRIPPHLVNYRANVAALAELGADAIVGTAAVGGIGPATGSIVIPDQIIDYTYGREQTFSDGSQPQPQHIDFTEPYSNTLRENLIAAATSAGIPVTSTGVYAATQGPRLETAAEIDKLERDGCTLVGMTGMPEAALARELQIDYANISLVVNAAAGRSDGPITMLEIERELAAGIVHVRAVFEQLAAILG